MQSKLLLIALLCLLIHEISGGGLSRFRKSFFGFRRFSRFDAVKYANCRVLPSPGYHVIGNIDFRQSYRCPLEVNVELEGFDITDAGVKHGFHVHEYGDLSGGCASAGGHFNPLKVNHGAKLDRVRHVGDFGNLIEDINGNNHTHFFDPRASLFSGFSDIIGRAIVVHAGEDDLGLGGDAGSLDNGNAGPRVGCCVIGVADGKRWEAIDIAKAAAAAVVNPNPINAEIIVDNPAVVGNPNPIDTAGAVDTVIP